MAEEPENFRQRLLSAPRVAADGTEADRDALIGWHERMGMTWHV